MTLSISRGMVLGSSGRGRSIRNTLTASNTFTNWANFGFALTPDAEAGPVGYPSTLFVAGGIGDFLARQISIDAGTWRLSIYLKGQGGGVGKTGRVWAWFNGTAVGSGGNAAVTLSGAYQRAGATLTVTTAGTLNLRIDSSSSFVAADAMFVSAIQLEPGSTSTAYQHRP